MPANCRGWAHWVSGWTGSVSLTDGVDTVAVSPTGVQSALAIWKSLAEAAEAQWPGQSWTWGLSESGGYLEMEGTASRTLAFSGGLNTLLGFSGGSTGLRFLATSHARGLVGDDAVLFTNDVYAGERGAVGVGRAMHSPTPGTAPRTPRLEALVSRARLLRWLEDTEYWAYPGKVDVYTDPETLTVVRMETYSTRHEGLTGYHRIGVEGAR